MAEFAPGDGYSSDAVLFQISYDFTQDGMRASVMWIDLM
jgi:hypothetical protein